MEIDMTGKLTAIVAAAIVLGSVGVASAQTHRYVPRAHWQAPYADSYYNRDYWAGVGRYGTYDRFDPYAGTVFEGVAPY
jgi:hypothetical protein